MIKIGSLGDLLTGCCPNSFAITFWGAVRGIFFRLVSLYGTLSCAWSDTIDTSCHQEAGWDLTWPEKRIPWRLLEDSPDGSSELDCEAIWATACWVTHFLTNLNVPLNYLQVALPSFGKGLWWAYSEQFFTNVLTSPGFSHHCAIQISNLLT